MLNYNLKSNFVPKRTKTAGRKSKMKRRIFLCSMAATPAVVVTKPMITVAEAIKILERALESDPKISRYEVGYSPGEKVSLVIAAYAANLPSASA